jgi:hypothetical protein
MFWHRGINGGPRTKPARSAPCRSGGNRLCRERRKDFLDAREGGALRDQSRVCGDMKRACGSSQKPREGSSPQGRDPNRGSGSLPCRRVEPGRPAARPFGREREIWEIRTCAKPSEVGDWLIKDSWRARNFAGVSEELTGPGDRHRPARRHLLTARLAFRSCRDQAQR